MGELIRKSQNVSLIMYYFVFVEKYRRLVINVEVDNLLKDVYVERSKRYEVLFLEIGDEGDDVQLLIQSVSEYSPTKIVSLVKSMTVREIFLKEPVGKKQLWGGEFWSNGYFVSTVGEHANEEVIREHPCKQFSASCFYTHYIVLGPSHFSCP